MPRPVKAYHEIQEKEILLKTREIMDELPVYVKQFFLGIQDSTQPKTRLAYAYDLRRFFTYLQENNPVFSKKSLKQISLEDLQSLNSFDIEEYLDYMKLYEDKDMIQRENKTGALKRKLSSLRSFYRYLYKNHMIEQNPTDRVSMPKMREKAIVRLEVEEVARLLDMVDSGERLTERQKAFHKRTRNRDLALLTLLLGTGLRVSECVGLNRSDMDFERFAMKVYRKGGKEAILYFGDEVAEAMLPYLEERKTMDALPPDEDALFLSLQQRRMSVRTVENLVKKYASTVTTMKNITPHKLRSTYGTNLYRETGDIYLVADVLGHTDVNTTRKHYAAMAEDKRRSARNKVPLREEAPVHFDPNEQKTAEE